MAFIDHLCHCDTNAAGSWPIFQLIQVSKKQSPADCQQKSCYCREGRTPKKTESRTSEKNPETRVTWDQILSKHLNLGARPEQIPTKMNQYCQGEEKPRPVERPRSLGGEKWCRRTLDDWCHPECFVKDLALNQPGDLLDLKTEIDRAVKKMGLKDCCPPEEPTRDFNRPKVVLEYLEELSVEMLKKRLEETESRYKNMRKKLEDALVNNKLEIQSLKSELFIKNEEVTRLLKNQESQVNATTAKRREMEFIERITSLDDRIKHMLDRDEKTNKELEKYQRLVAELKLDLSQAREERDLFHAKMEIYQQERDKAVASLSVYEKTFKNLKHEIGEEIRGIRPSLELTADSFGTLDTTGRGPRDVVTSSPNVSYRSNDDSFFFL
uniref:Tip elongation protein 1 n=2 Tax=Lygus hesperus TaxID=30085 RepID=A0A0A9X4C8_LYGHE